MADTKISALTALAGSGVDTAADVLAIVDTDAGATKKILMDEVANALKATAAEVNAMTSTNTLLTPNHNKIVLGTEQASTSGTALDFTGIPAGVRKITINFVGVSTSGTDKVIVQLGDAGGIENTGYLGAVTLAGGTPTNYGASFILDDGANAGAVRHGTATLNLEDSSDFTWTFTAVIGRSDTTAISFAAGSKALSAELTQLRITTISASDTFDAGAINISFER